MFKYIFKKLNNWFIRITSPISYNETYLATLDISNGLVPEVFSKVHSSNFNTLTLSCYKKTLEEYNEMSTSILKSIKKGVKPTKSFEEIFNITLPKFFLTKHGNFCRESDLIIHLQKNVKEIVDWLLNYEKNTNFTDSSLEYMFMKRLHDSNLELLNILTKIQESFK